MEAMLQDYFDRAVQNLHHLDSHKDQYKALEYPILPFPSAACVCRPSPYCILSVLSYLEWWYVCFEFLNLKTKNDRVFLLDGERVFLLECERGWKRVEEGGTG